MRQQLPLTLPDSEPEPDVALVTGSVESHRDRLAEVELPGCAALSLSVDALFA